jgi:hypothetical protein
MNSVTFSRRLRPFNCWVSDCDRVNGIRSPPIARRARAATIGGKIEHWQSD